MGEAMAVVTTHVKKRLEELATLMDPVIEDTAVPRNIRSAVVEAKNKILNDSGELSVRLSSALYRLDDISNDINMPSHTRTEIWNIVSELERLKEELLKE